jgi:outer membrane protein assembly factor BamA
MAIGMYPLNRYARIDVSAGFMSFDEEFDDPALEEYSRQYQIDTYGTEILREGEAMPLGIAFTQEDTVFREFGPLSGTTMRISYEMSPSFGNLLSYQTVDVDARWYKRLGGSGLLALRAKGFRSWGDNPSFFYFGGNSELRGYDYLSFVGQQGGFLNAELRFPLIEAMLTPIGVLGGIRGVFFAGMGGATFPDQVYNYKFATSSTINYTPLIGYQLSSDGTTYVPIYGNPVTISGFRLQDGRASYGIGLESFFLGFPIHFDFSWKTLFNREWEDALFAYQGGSEEFRKMKFTVWIGYDF